MKFPKPIEIARCSGNWAMKSQDFFIAGKTLINEQLLSGKRIHASVGQVIDERLEEDFAKVNMSSSIVFLLAFSIELLVKAVLIERDAIKWIPDEGKMNFLGHDIFTLATEEIGIQVTENEEEIIKRIGEYVSWGKYPERIAPNRVNEEWKDKFGYHPYVSWSLVEFLSIIGSIRNKLNEKYRKYQKNS
jgi:hypothetical protein